MAAARAWWWAVGAGVAMGALGAAFAFAPRATLLPRPEPPSPRTVRSANEPSRANTIAISSNSVTARGKVIDNVGYEEQVALQGKEGDFTKPLEEAFKAEFAPGAEVAVTVKPDVAYLSVGRVMLALLALGFESVSLELPRGRVRIALGRATYLHGEAGLLVLIVTSGVGIKGPGGNVAPGCRDLGPGIAIPRVGSELALPALRDCVARLVQSDSHLGRAFLVANPKTPFREIAQTVDTLSAAGAPLVGLRL